MRILAIIAKFILGIGVALSFILVPLCLILTGMEVFGPISSGYVPYELGILVFCFTPSLLGSALLVFTKSRQRLDYQKLIKRCLILLIIQLTASGLIAALNPKDNSSHVDYSNPTGRLKSEQIDNINKILRPTE